MQLVISDQGLIKRRVAGCDARSHGSCFIPDSIRMQATKYPAMTDLTTLSGVLCLLGFLQWLLKLTLGTSDKRYPDGPNPLGIFGNIFTLKRLLHSPDNELMKMSRAWGDTCMVWAARYPILVVNKAQVAKELLVDVGASPNFTNIKS